MENRRNFLKNSVVFVGALSTVGLAGTLSNPREVAAAEVIKSKATKVKPKLVKTVKLDRRNVGKLGNNLFESKSERQKFLSNPLGYAQSFFGGKLDRSSEAQLKLLKDSLAFGMCCDGCSCGVPALNVKIRTF